MLFGRMVVLGGRLGNRYTVWSKLNLIQLDCSSWNKERRPRKQIPTCQLVSGRMWATFERTLSRKCCSWWQIKKFRVARESAGVDCRLEKQQLAHIYLKRGVKSQAGNRRWPQLIKPTLQYNHHKTPFTPVLFHYLWPNQSDCPRTLWFSTARYQLSLRLGFWTQFRD